LTKMPRDSVSARKSPGAVAVADFESEFENVQILQTAFDKPVCVVESIFKEIDERANWLKRCNAIKKLRSAMLDAELSILILSDIPKLARKLNSCFTDLRSQIVRETCITFAFIAQLEKSKCDRLAEFCLPTILDLVNASAKIISSSASVASTIMFKHVQSFRLIAVLVDKCNSKSRDVRRLCASLVFFLMKTWSYANLRKIPKIQLANLISKIIDDADQKVRADGQEAFASLYKFDEELAMTVVKRFTGARRRQIDSIVTSLRNKAQTVTPVAPKPVTTLKPSALPVLIANQSPAKAPLSKRTPITPHLYKSIRNTRKPTLSTDVKLSKKQDLKLEKMENNPKISRDNCLLEMPNKSDSKSTKKFNIRANEMKKIDQMMSIVEPTDMELETTVQPTEKSGFIEEITGKCRSPVTGCSLFERNLSSDGEILFKVGNIDTSARNADDSTTVKNESLDVDISADKLQFMKLDSSEKEDVSEKQVEKNVDEISQSEEIDLIQFSTVGNNEEEEEEEESDLISLPSVCENSKQLPAFDRRITLSVFDAVSFPIKKFDEKIPFEDINLIEFSQSISSGDELSCVVDSPTLKEQGTLEEDGGKHDFYKISCDICLIINYITLIKGTWLTNRRYRHHHLMRPTFVMTIMPIKVSQVFSFCFSNVNLEETAIESSDLEKDTEPEHTQFSATFEDDLIQMDIIMEICQEFSIPEVDTVIQSIHSWPDLVSLYCHGNKEMKPVVIFALERLFNANQHLPLANDVHTQHFLRKLLEDIFLRMVDGCIAESMTLLLLINEKQSIETLRDVAVNGNFSLYLIKLLDDIISVFNIPE
ncbi:CLIP-associating protein 1, partial [Trichinella papuae]